MPTVPNGEAAPAGAKPPFLRRVRVRGYKSIAYCDVALEPLTILVGRNASGKSNFLDALAFLRDMVKQGVNYALEAHGGMAVFFQEPNTSRLRFEVEAAFPSYRTLCQAAYQVELALNAHRQLEVKEEVLHIEDQTGEPSCGFTAARGQVAWYDVEFRGGKYRRIPPKEDQSESAAEDGSSRWPRYRPDRLLLSVIDSQPGVDLAGMMGSIGCYNFQPATIRKPQSRVGSPVLKWDGHNLPRAIEGLKEIQAPDLDRIKAYLRAIVPEIEGFEVFPIADYETIRFQVRTTSERPPLQLYAASMSDGTLRALASLVAAFQIHLPIGPGLIAIEEPEASLHPAAMRALVDALDEVTLRNQILLTTHSADLLDNPTIRPENVRVVQLVDGQTVIAPVDEASVDIVRRDLNTLGGLERDNLLEPDPADLERQRQRRQTPQDSPA